MRLSRPSDIAIGDAARVAAMRADIGALEELLARCERALTWSLAQCGEQPEAFSVVRDVRALLGVASKEAA